jgi:16S rRNA U516 pseudouridylate synthase RsuA-like enzyme
MKCQLCSYNNADFCYGCTNDKVKVEREKIVRSLKDFIEKEINTLEEGSLQSTKNTKPSFTATLAELEKLHKWIELKYERRE